MTLTPSAVAWIEVDRIHHLYDRGYSPFCCLDNLLHDVLLHRILGAGHVDRAIHHRLGVDSNWNCSVLGIRRHRSTSCSHHLHPKEAWADGWKVIWMSRNLGSIVKSKKIIKPMFYVSSADCNLPILPVRTSAVVRGRSRWASPTIIVPFATEFIPPSLIVFFIAVAHIDAERVVSWQNKPPQML